MKKKNFTFIKLGGSLITEKNKENTLKEDTLFRVLSEIVAASKTNKEHYLLGNGQGSFAHIPAKKYQTKDGFVNRDSVYGMAVTHHSAGHLTRIIIDYLLKKDVPAIRYHLSNALVLNNDTVLPQKLDVLFSYLDAGLIPVTCGDVLVDSEKGCTIWSTEKIFNYIISCMHLSDYKVSKVLHVTDVDGVLDQTGTVISKITPQDSDILSLVSGSSGIDVTGGMRHKIEESFNLLKQHNTSSVILSGEIQDNVLKCLTRKKFVGTTISN